MILPLLSVEKAQRQILDVALLGNTKRLPFNAANGYILAAHLFANTALPSFENSAMDGFICLASDVEKLPFSLKLKAEIPAGTKQLPVIENGFCYRIMTGAPLPMADIRVIPIEWTSQNGERVTFSKISEKGQFVRKIGEDIQKGQPIGSKFQPISAFDIGLWASVGCLEVPVFAKPKVALFTTGNEIIDPHIEPNFGELRNANRYALHQQMVDAGAEVVFEAHLPDNISEIIHTLKQVPHADVWLFSGGVSMGKYDLIRPALDQIGWKPMFWKVAQRPGKPLAFGTLDDTLVFGLPGNPVSSAICFDQYVRLALLKMQGILAPQRTLFTAPLGEALQKPADLHVFWRAYIEDGKLFSAGAQGSHVYSSFQKTKVIAHLPVGQSLFEIGDIVNYEIIL